MTDRWANTKSKINSNKTPGTGLETHYKEGCSQNLGPDLASVRVTLVNTWTPHMKNLLHVTTSQDQVVGAGNVRNLNLSRTNGSAEWGPIMDPTD